LPKSSSSDLIWPSSSPSPAAAATVEGGCPDCCCCWSQSHRRPYQLPYEGMVESGLCILPSLY
jgi:hypothetical protein